MKSLQTAAIVSPCIKICQLDGSGICLGCFRTRDEIALWSQLNDFTKSFINEVADERHRLHLQNLRGDAP